MDEGEEGSVIPFISPDPSMSSTAGYDVESLGHGEAVGRTSYWSLTGSLDTGGAAGHPTPRGLPPISDLQECGPGPRGGAERHACSCPCSSRSELGMGRDTRPQPTRQPEGTLRWTVRTKPKKSGGWGCHLFPRRPPSGNVSACFGLVSGDAAHLSAYCIGCGLLAPVIQY